MAKRHILRRLLLLVGSLILVGSSLISSAPSLQSPPLLSYGRVTNPIQIDVDVNFSRRVAINNLSIGVQIAQDWENLGKYAELQGKFVESKFRIVRFFMYHTQPCKTWNETTKTGIYNWTKFDSLMQAILNVGIRNILISVALANASVGLPEGMDRNYNNTGYPNKESFALYCKDIALHLRDKGWSVKFWEPYNEPCIKDYTTYRALVDSFNTASDAILQVFPNALFGVDASNRKQFLDNFVYDGRNVGFLSFHKYDASGTWLHNPEGYYSDEEVLKRASMLGDDYHYTPQEMRDKWRSVRGVELPVFVTESNLNWCYINGTDPRIQQVIGAAWYAEELRSLILSDVKCSVYFTFASDDSPRWGKDVFTRGYGFGMINMTTPHEEWYPYFVNVLFGNYLDFGDELYDCSSSNSTTVSTLAWGNNGYYNVLLIGKIKSQVNVRVNIRNADVKNGQILFFKIDSNDQKLQITERDFTDRISLLEKGYFVILLRIS